MKPQKPSKKNKNTPSPNSLLIHGVFYNTIGEPMVFFPVLSLQGSLNFNSQLNVFLHSEKLSTMYVS